MTDQSISCTVTHNMQKFLCSAIYGLNEESSHYNGSQVPNADSKEFIECIQKIAVLDHVSSGPFFTWTNKQDQNFLAKNLTEY
ncbi:hypothetical protein DITRI_Ditri13aG0147000 [Diplodiscus trichospermus]